jgi:hypothetical protein
MTVILGNLYYLAFGEKFLSSWQCNVEMYLTSEHFTMAPVKQVTILFWLIVSYYRT